MGSNLLGLQARNGITRERALQSLQPSLHTARRFAIAAVSERRLGQSGAEWRHGRPCGDTAGRAERSPMPTAGSLDLPSFRATGDHRAGAGGSAQQRGEQRHHARAARKAGAALRDVSTGVDSAPRGIDRPRLQVPHRPAACSCERRWRRAGGTRTGGSLRSRGARVGGRRVRTQAGLLRARERPAGSGGAGVHARWRSAEGRRLVGTQTSWPARSPSERPRR